MQPRFVAWLQRRGTREDDFHGSSRGEACVNMCTATEQGHLPGIRGMVITQDVNAAVVSAHLEIAAIRVQPAVYDLANPEFALAKKKTAR